MPVNQTPKNIDAHVTEQFNSRARQFIDLVLNRIRTYTILNLTGKVLKVRTGRLRSSIFAYSNATTSGKIIGSIGTNVFYGRIWELTGHKAYTITPKNAKALMIPVGKAKSATSKSGFIFRRSAKIPAADARPFIAPAILKADPYIKMLHAKRFQDVTSTIKLNIKYEV